jgi:hypothetical protein
MFLLTEAIAGCEILRQKKYFKAVVISIFTCTACSSEKVNFNDHLLIYGDDDRRDIYQVEDSAKRALARSVALLIKDSELDIQEDESIVLQGDSLKTKYKVCDSEPFAEQPSVGFCTGFLVRPDIIASAGHCFEDQSICQSTSIVFDYAYSTKTTNPKLVKTAQIYPPWGEELSMTKPQQLRGKDIATTFGLNKSPVYDLDGLRGKDCFGTWSVTITDTSGGVANSVTGTLNSLQLMLLVTVDPSPI